MTNAKTEAQIEQERDEAYAEYIMEHRYGDRLICNGDMLIQAMEDGYLYDDFMASIEGGQK